MVRVVAALHDPSSQLLRALIRALSDGKLWVVDISQMRGAAGGSRSLRRRDLAADPCDPHSLQEGDRYAQVVDLDLVILQ